MKISSLENGGEKVLMVLMKNGKTKMGDVADELNYSYPWIEKVVGKLKSGGLVKAIRGCQGGLVLAKEDISYFDILVAFNGDKLKTGGFARTDVFEEMLEVAKKYKVGVE